MSDKKTLLEEGTIRRFMKLANMEALGTGFVNEMYGKMMKDDEDRPKKEDDLDEGQRMKDDEERPKKKKDDLDEDIDEGMRPKKDDDDKKMREEVDLEERGGPPPMADDEERKDDDMKDDPMEEMMGKDHGGMKDDAMADDMEMDLDVKDEEEEMDMDAGDMGELTLTDEEAEVFLKVADKVRAAMEMESPEEMPAPDMGDEGGARPILMAVIKEGDLSQQAEARELLLRIEAT